MFRYFLDFIIYGLLLDPLGWAVLSFLVLQFHKKNHNITQTIVYAVIRKETVKDLLFYWSIDFICLILSFNVFNNSIITVSSEFFVLILTPILSFYSLFLYLVKKNGLYLEFIPEHGVFFTLCYVLEILMYKEKYILNFYF